jgi:Tfp pilus assembly protein PilF
MFDDDEDRYEEEEDEDQLDDFDARDTVESFLLAWTEQDYEEAYSYLASTSELREGLSEGEWVKRREAWAEQAEPESLQLDIVYNSEEALPANVVSMHKEVEVFWSLEMKDSPLSETLKELPMGTAVYKETGRHWFWAKYRLIEENEQYAIQSIFDEGAAAFQLSTEELDQRMDALAENVKELAEEMNVDVDNPDTEQLLLDAEDDDVEEDDDELDDLDFEEVEDQIHEIIWVTKRGMHYSDALIAQAPDHADYYQRATGQALAIQEWERAAVYLEATAERFPELRSDTVAAQVLVLTSLVGKYEEEGLYDRLEQFMGLIEKTLREAVATDNNFISNILLSTLLIANEDRFDEAEPFLRQAQALAKEPKEQAQVENNWARLADARGQTLSALQHYERAAELDPETPEVWFNIGSAQRDLHQNEQAIRSFLRAIQASPDDSEAYVEAARLYIDQGKLAKARELLDEGLDTIPEAADLYAARAIVYIREGKLREAEELIIDAEEMDSDLDIVQEARQLFNAHKAQRQQSKPKFHKQKPKPKKKR